VFFVAILFGKPQDARIRPMADDLNREHYIPLRQSELVELLARDDNLPAGDRAPFLQFCRLVAAVFHYEYHDHLLRLKDAYAPFDPDADTRALRPLTDAGRQERLDKLFADFTWLMGRANFKHLSRDEIRSAMAGYSDWGVNLDVDFDCFERLEVFVRGDTTGRRTRRRLTKLYRQEEVQLPVFKRLVLILKQRPHRRLGENPDVRSVYLKVFKDIPKLDVEMLLPGGQVMMPGFQRLKLGGSLASSVGYIGFKMYQEMTHLVQGWLMRNPLTFWGPISLVLGYGYRQYYGYQQTRQTYSHRLTQSLYYQNMDSNAGVLFRLLDEAEEQECREAVLAYYLLWRQAGDDGWVQARLDDAVEEYLRQRAGLEVDFEIGDALAKLERLGVVERFGEAFRARPVEQALDLLDGQWDNYFHYNDPARV
jgi:hypothetical protein